jgi:peptide methionine sulfoxide reductase MsrA
MIPSNDTAKANPTYRERCAGTADHVEVPNVELKDPAAHFAELIKFFSCFLADPTTLIREGKTDIVGTQYSPVVFRSDEKQLAVTTKVKQYLQNTVDSDEVTSYKQQQTQMLRQALSPTRSSFRPMKNINSINGQSLRRSA